MPKKKALPSKKRGPKPESLKVAGGWSDAMRLAMKRGKSPKPKEKE